MCLAYRDQSVLLDFLVRTACPEQREVLAQQVLPVRKGHVVTQVTLEKQVWQEGRVLPARVEAAVQAVNQEPLVARASRDRRDHWDQRDHRDPKAFRVREVCLAILVVRWCRPMSAQLTTADVRMSAWTLLTATAACAILDTN